MQTHSGIAHNSEAEHIFGKDSVHPVWLNGELIRMYTPKTHLLSMMQVCKATLQAILSVHNTKFLIHPPLDTYTRTSAANRNPWPTFYSLLHRQYVEGLSFDPPHKLLNLNIPSYMYSKFTTLDFSHKDFTRYDLSDVSIFLRRCTNLQYLYLASTHIDDENIAYLAQGLRSVPFLLHLDLSQNLLTSAGAPILANGLGSCTLLQCLKVEDNEFEDEGVQFLADALVQCTALSHLNLSRNILCPGSARPLAAILHACMRLKHLDLAYNGICIDGLQVLAHSTEKGFALQHLNLSRNYLVKNGDAEKLFNNIVTMIEKSPSLEYLNLSENDIRNRFDRLTPALANCTGLTTLNLSQNGTDNGIDTLLLSLERCQYLTHLDLSGNLIVPVEARNIGIYLHMLKRCTHLNLSSCGIAIDEAEALTQNEVLNYSFESLNLSYNNFEDVTMAYIFEFLVKCKELKYLDVSYCQIDQTHAILLDKLSLECPKISYLDARNNDCRNLYSRGLQRQDKTMGECHARLLTICSEVEHRHRPVDNA